MTSSRTACTWIGAASTTLISPASVSTACVARPSSGRVWRLTNPRFVRGETLVEAKVPEPEPSTTRRPGLLPLSGSCGLYP